jgi:Domain of unknown function (DUF4263)
MLTGFTDESRLSEIQSLMDAGNERVPEDERSRYTNYGLIAACREIVFDIRDGLPVFTFVAYSLDVDRFAIVVQPLVESFHDPSEDSSEVDDDVVNTLAMAAALGIPVYPNTEDVAPVLGKYHRTMLLEGFTAPDAGGAKVRLKLVRSPGERIDDPRYVTQLDPCESLSPAEIVLIKGAVSAELGRLWEAERALTTLRFAIGELEGLLGSHERIEGKLQMCLTDNPVLFGPDYVRIIPKHSLGSEFEMDYALERHSGLVDLVEIEAASLPLFNKNGDPSRYLIHAEQQVIDWLTWVERNSAYARETLPELMAPVGYVVIGRTENTAAPVEKLKRRNALFRGTVVILTYDQLLDRAKQVLRYLEGAPTSQLQSSGIQADSA